MVVVIVLTICTTIIIPNCYHVCGPKSLSLIIPVLQSSDNYSHFQMKKLWIEIKYLNHGHRANKWVSRDLSP